MSFVFSYFQERCFPANITDARSVKNLIECTSNSIKAIRKVCYQHFTIDIDSLPIETYGHQDGSKYNGYYKHTCYHPLVAMLAETGHILDIKLRPGNVHSANGLSDFLFPLIDDVEGKIGMIASVRGDAGMPNEADLSKLEERGIGYAFRLKSNHVLKRLAESYLSTITKDKKNENNDDKKKGTEDDTDEWAFELSYQAKSWSRPRRIVLIIIEKYDQIDALEPYNYFFLVTNWTEDQSTGFELLDFYRKRGTMERWIGEFKDVLEPALSCVERQRKDGSTRIKIRSFMDCNDALLLLYALAYNLLNTARRLMEKATGDGWSLRRLREQVLKTAVRFTLHARRIDAWITRTSADLWQLLGLNIAKLHPI